MGAGRRTQEVSRLHIPERHLWTPDAAETYLNDEGRINLDDNAQPNFELRPVPLISEEYPVVDVQALAEDIKGLFVPGARFPRTYLKRTVHMDRHDDMDVTTVIVMPIPMPDDIEHVQGIENYVKDGKKIDERAFAFCNDPERQMVIPRLPHNVKTAIYAPPTPPHPDLMESHRVGHRLALNLYKSALTCVNRGYGFVGRAEAIKNGLIVPLDHDPATVEQTEAYADIIDDNAAAYFRTRSKKHRKSVETQKLALAKQMPSDSFFYKVGIEAVEARPARIINILSKVATDQPWSYADFIRGRVDFQTAQNTHKNRMERRLAREAMLKAA